MKKSNRPVFIFDITSILFRMYCSGVEKTSQDGLEVGGVFGVALSMQIVSSFPSTVYCGCF